MISHAQYLAAPEQLAHGFSGLACGNEHVALRYHAQRYLIEGLNQTQANWVRTRFEAILDNNSHDTIATHRISALFAPRATFTNFSTRGFEYAVAADFTVDHVHASGLGFAYRLSRDLNTPSTVWFDSDVDRWFDSAFENMLRVVCAYAIAKAGGLVVHSAAVSATLTPDTQDNVYVFFGRSGAGKTTLCEMSQPLGYEILSDELNALIYEKGQWWVKPMPFAGDFGAHTNNFSLRTLAAIFQLNQAPTVHIDTMSKAVATAALASACPLMSSDPYETELLLANLAAVLEKIEIRRLFLRKDATFWQHVRNESARHLSLG